MFLIPVVKSPSLNPVSSYNVPAAYKCPYIHQYLELSLIVI